MSLFFSIATLFLSIAVVVIAWQQWQVANNKLRLDLFDRRYKVYDATRNFLAVILREATFTNSQLFEFYAGTSDAEFLLAPMLWITWRKFDRKPFICRRPSGFTSHCQ
jgi:hypothetical protein